MERLENPPENHISYRKEQLEAELKHSFGTDSPKISKRRKAPSPLAIVR